MSTDLSQFSPANRCNTPESLTVTRHSRILMHCPHPVGWIALTAHQLRAARSRARDMLESQSSADPVIDVGMCQLTRPLYTPEDAAKALAVDVSWLLRQAREGVIPHVRLGKYVRFDPREIIGRSTKVAMPRPLTRGSAIRSPG
jgi:excisionase family DNA binding protein